MNEKIMLTSISVVLALLAGIQITSQQSEKNNTSTFGPHDFLRSFGAEDNGSIRSVQTKSYGALCSEPTRSCESIFQCDKLFEMFQKGKFIKAEERQTLRDHVCGWGLGAPNVCCEDYLNLISNRLSIKPQQKQPTTPTPPSSTFQKCGDNMLSKENKNRIVGDAKPALLGAWPWMAALYARFGNNGIPRFRCGGTLIAKEWVLTAAHCIPGTNSKEELVHVVLGDLDLNKTIADGAAPIEVKIVQIIKHPEYTERPDILNDIALLRLRKPVEYNMYIQPICLHSGSKYLNDSLFYNNKAPNIAGWGYTSVTDKIISSHLMEAEIHMVNNVKCGKNYDGHAKIDQSVMCAGKNGKDACQGDSGGPLMFKNFKTDTWSQGGIVSFGKGCGEKDYPGVYTRVAAFTNWIETTTKLKF